MSSIKNYLVLSHLQVCNANAQASPITIGIPSITAFLGAIHKLQRELNHKGYENLCFNGVGIIIHEFNLKTFFDRFNRELLVASSNPLKMDKKNEGQWVRPSTIPDPKIDFTVSLMCEVGCDYLDDEAQFISDIDDILLNGLRIAGGIIDIPCSKQGGVLNSYGSVIKYYPRIDQDDDKAISKIIRPLIPGYALIERRELLQEAMKEGIDPIVALIDYLAIHHDCIRHEDGYIEWNSHRRADGWIVPIVVGYQGLSEPMKVDNQRDNDTDHVFGESLITLGEYRMVNTIYGIDWLLWKYKTDLEKSLYMCICNGGE